MLAIALIVFRESLEAALIVGIVLAASVGIPGRGRWVGGGIAAGVAGACVVAAFAAVIADAFQGVGQEILNATILLVAAGMCGWHNIWMATHAREAARDARATGRAVAEGNRPIIALAAIPAMAVLREGAETVLFVFGIASGATEPVGVLALGGLAGLVGGALLGTLLYLGLVRIPASRMFAVTGWMVLLLAAGLASQAAGFLVQADILPALGQGVWDTSFLIGDDSLLGRVLHAMVGYVARPQGIQVLAFLTMLALIGVPMWRIARTRPAGTGAVTA